MPKIDPTVLKEFGRAVKRARVIKGWDQKTLGANIEPQVGASFISKVEKGRKVALDARTVGRFRIALNLDEAWIDKFLDAEDAAESLETKSEQDADRVIDRLRHEGKAEGASDDLLIQLANNFTEGDYKDRETAYRSVEAALERLKASEHITQLTSNADAQFAALMQEVDALNRDGEFDLAHDKLAQQAARLREDKVRLARLSGLQFEKRLNQDRLRNRPDLAAERIVRNLPEAPKDKLFWDVNTKVEEWREIGDKAGDVFALQVALALASYNYGNVKAKESQSAAALFTLGWCHLNLAQRLTGDRHLNEARRVMDAAAKITREAKDKKNLPAVQDGLGQALRELGERRKDPVLLGQAVVAHREALKNVQETHSGNLEVHWNNLGFALLRLGVLTNDPETLREAEGAYVKGLVLNNKEHDPLGWQITQSNLAHAQRWLGALTSDPAKLKEASNGFAACEDLAFQKDAPSQWAWLQWNIADLKLVRYQFEFDPILLSDARTCLIRARAFFIERSDNETERCDELLAQVNTAAAN